MRSKLSKLARLTPADCWQITFAYLYLLQAGWRLFIRREKVDRWVMSSPIAFPKSLQPPLTKGRLEDMAEGSGANKLLTEEKRRTMARRARWLNAVARYPRPWARCLQRSLALCLWLERQGFNPELKIGVRKEGAALEAHAWVEYCGEVINDSPDVSQIFAPMAGSSVVMARAKEWVRGNYR